MIACDVSPVAMFVFVSNVKSLEICTLQMVFVLARATFYPFLDFPKQNLSKQKYCEMTFSNTWIFYQICAGAGSVLDLNGVS